MKRRRGLGSSAAVHNASIGRLRAVADLEAKQAGDLARAGNCNGAVHALSRASFAAGRADAHAQSAGHGKQAYSILAHAVEKVTDACARIKW